MLKPLLVQTPAQVRVNLSRSTGATRLLGIAEILKQYKVTYLNSLLSTLCG